MSDQPAQTLAVFLLDNDDAARRFLKTVQKIDQADDNVKIVDAAIADRTKRRGKVKVHQTEDTGAMKGGIRGGAIGVIAGTILLGPVGAVIGGAAGGLLAGLHNRFRDIGIDDKFMREIGGEVEKGKSALFVLYEGDWSGSRPAVEEAVKTENALLIHSTLSAETAAALQALVAPAAEELGGEEVVADYEVETEEAAAAEAAAAEPAAPEAEPDDLTKIAGVGPKGSEVLVAAGIDSYARLARTSEPDLRRAFSEAHTSVPRNVNTWAMQASFAEKGDWSGLKAFAKQSQPAEPVKAATPSQEPEPDDLTNLAGIGPKAAKALAAAGIRSYQSLANANEPQLRKALHDADMTAPANVVTWPMQAAYAVKGDWRSLSRYNQKAAQGKAPAPKPPAAAAAPAAPAAKPDDLTQLTGIGPRIASFLVDGGVTTYAQLQHMSTEQLQDIIANGGALPPASLSTWPSQAAYAAKGDWQGLAAYNKRQN